MDWEYTFKKGLKKVENLYRTLGGRFPHITKDGKWLTSVDGHWTGGFWVGLLWMNALYPKRQEDKMKEALIQALKLKQRLTDNKTHDMGFIFGPSGIWGSRLVEKGKEELMEMAIKGAHNLRHLYEETSQAIYAWDEPDYRGISIVDTIMNLPILIWTADQTGEEDLRQMALKVANQIATNHVRDDFSTYHVVRWNPGTHQMVERTTHQGFSSGSCWSRGQAWALYGFANMYRYTGEVAYLQTAQNVAHYFWQHLDSTLPLPKWDFLFRDKPEEPMDAAAASIAASGMLLLSQLLEKEEEEVSHQWKNRAERILEALINQCFCAKEGSYRIIGQVTVDKPRNSGINESAMYGDYYFMEALYRLLNEERAFVLEKLY